MLVGDQPCLQHCTKQKFELDLECLQCEYGTSLGNKDSSNDLQALNATGEEWVTLKVRTARMLRIRWKKMGLSS